MSRIYVYVDGSDLQEVESMLLTRFTEFSLAWGVDSVQVINDKFLRTPNLAPGDFPDWNLGLNFETENISHEKIIILVAFLEKLAKESGRDFVIGACSQINGVTEDWCFVGIEAKPETISFLMEQLQ